MVHDLAYLWHCTCPHGVDFLDLGRSEIRHRRPASHPFYEVGDDGRDLRLLQHDFGDPDAVGEPLLVQVG